MVEGEWVRGRVTELTAGSPVVEDGRAGHRLPVVGIQLVTQRGDLVWDRVNVRF